MKNFRTWVLATVSLFFLLACSESQIRQLPIPPTIDLDFTGGRLPDGLTFTRNSAATYADKDGWLKEASIDEPRFDYDPATLEMRGLLIEDRATNLIRYSEAFDQWVQVGTYMLVDVDKSPTGLLSADLFTSTTTNGRHFIYWREPITVADTFYTLSCYFKPRSHSYVGLFLGTGSIDEPTNKAGYLFDVIHNKAVPVSGHPAIRLVNPVIQKFNNEYYRCSFCFRTARATGVTIAIQVRPDSAQTDSYVTDGKSGGYLWGAQLEMGPVTSSYIPTSGVTATRETDLCLINNVSNWFNATEGTWVAETALGEKRVARIVGYDSPGNFLGISPSSPAVIESWNGSVNVIKAGNQSTGIVRHGMTYTATSRTITREGLKPVTSKTPNGKITQVAIGANTNGRNALNAHIRKIQYYSFAQPDTLLRLLTQ